MYVYNTPIPNTPTSIFSHGFSITKLQVFGLYERPESPSVPKSKLQVKDSLITVTAVLSTDKSQWKVVR